MPRKIVFAGEGGQGVQLVAKITSIAAENSGKNSTYLPSFGVEQRGGVSIAFVKIGSNPIVYPRFAKADIIVAFGNRAIEEMKKYADDNTLFIYDNSAINNDHLSKIQNQIKNYLAIPALDISKKKYSIKSANMLLLGGLSAHLKEIDYSKIENAILQELKSKIAKKPEIKEFNLNALKEGREIAESFDQQNVPFEGADKKEIERTFKKEGVSWTRFPEYCKGCSLCIVTCPVHALKFSSDAGFLGTPLPIVDIETCTGCLKCQHICPDGAIRVDKSS